MNTPEGNATPTMTASVRARLRELTAADPYSRYPVDLLNYAERNRLPRERGLIRPSPDFERHMAAVWDAADLLTATYGRLTRQLVRQLADLFVTLVPVLELHDWDEYEDSGWVGGGPPGRSVAWSVDTTSEPGLVTVWNHMTGCGRRFRPGALVRVLNRQPSHPDADVSRQTTT